MEEKSVSNVNLFRLKTEEKMLQNERILAKLTDCSIHDGCLYPEN